MATTSASRPTAAAAHRILGRAAYGSTPEAAAALMRDGLDAWVDRQLALPAEEPTLAPRVDGITARIYYAAGPGEQIVEGERRAVTLAMTQAERWAALNPAPGFRPVWQEVDRPRVDLSLATLLRRAEAEAQLRERLVEFWHDHFNVSFQASQQVSISLPDHDARIRDHALGRFRDLLDAVATSPAMLFYLNNQSSRTGAPNENFARELLELHTLGRAAYAGTARNPRAVPRDATGLALAYADADVWEVARAFTGWSVAAGQWVDAGTTLPRTGSFTFVDAWSDPYQKRVLGRDLDPFAPPMAHGRAVLDLLADHPATARFVTRKLARFLLGDPVPEAAAARAEAAFRRHARAPDQIARTVRALLAGPEIASAATLRVRRPADLLVAGVRALGIAFQPRAHLLGELQGAGQLLFGWSSPEGPPLDAAYWLSVSALRRRWSFALNLARNAWGTGAPGALADLANEPAEQIAVRLAERVLGPGGEAAGRAIGAAWTEAGRPGRLNAGQVAEVAGWVLAAPGFQAV
jgi:uncharacterized protein (DUF1800 family)